MSKRIALFGDDFGIPQLLQVVPTKDICCIVTASNRPEALKRLQQMSNTQDIPIIVQPCFRSTQHSAFIEVFSKLSPNLLFCNSYSMLLRADVLEVVKGLAFNIHWSLLPRNRGPNPIQWAIIHGDQYTGVSVHKMDTSFDTGDLVAQRREPIDFEDTWIDVRLKLTKFSQKLIADYVPLIISGHFNSWSQSGENSLTNSRLKPEGVCIDFSRMTDLQIYNLIRAQVTPLRGAYVEADNKRIYFNTFIPFRKIASLREKYASSMTIT